MKIFDLYFNNAYCSDLGLLVKEYISIPATQEIYDKVDIIGRNGSVYSNKGLYEDKQFEVTFTLRDTKIGFWNTVDRIKDWLYNIEDNRFIYDREDRCLLIKKVVVGDITRQIRSYRELKVTFIAEPFLYDIEETVSSYNAEEIANMIQENDFERFISLDICNVGDFPVFPTIELSVNGYVRIVGEGTQLDLLDTYTTSGNYLDITIDSKNKECTTNTDGSYPVINNNITFILGKKYAGETCNLNKLVIRYRNSYL